MADRSRLEAELARLKDTLLVLHYVDQKILLELLHLREITQQPGLRAAHDMLFVEIADRMAEVESIRNVLYPSMTQIQELKAMRREREEAGDG